MAASPPVLIVSLDAPREAVEQAAADGPVVYPISDDLAAVHAQWHEARPQRVVVLAADVAALRLALPVLPSLGLTRQIDLRLPAQELPGVTLNAPAAAAPLSGIASLAVQDVPGPLGTEVRITLRAPADLRTVLGGLVTAAPARNASRAASGLRVAAADVGALAWCVGDPSSRTSANADRSWRGDETRGAPADVVLRTDGKPPSPTDAVVADVARRCPPVDIAVAHPGGFDPEAESEVGYVVVTDLPRGQQVRIADADSDLALLGTGGRLSSTALDRLRALRHVDARAIHHAEPRLAAHVLTQLGAAGVPLVTGRLPPAVRALLHADVVAALADVTPEQTADIEAREAHSVRVRRAVHRHYSHTGAWRDLRPELGYRPAPAGRVSVQLVTMRRQFLSHAVRSVAQQQHVDLELVLVTHGFALDESERAALREQLPFPLVIDSIGADAFFGDALNVALSRASGEFVAKMDDDDWYGAHHLEDLLQTMAWSDATLVGALHEYTYLADIDVTAKRRVGPNRFKRPMHVPGGTMLLRREDLLAVGGWRPLRKAGPEDLSLSHAVRESGGTLQHAHGLGFVLCRHGRGHTWNVSSERFLEGSHQQWPGFHAPPELDNGPVTHDHYADVRAAAQAAAAADEQPAVSSGPQP